MHVVVITLFPEIYPGPLGCSLLEKARIADLWSLTCIDLRVHGTGIHQTVDSTPYGGGEGMVLRADVIDKALTEASNFLRKDNNKSDPLIFYPTPRGTLLTQHMLKKTVESKRDIILLCGRYEGVDERVLVHWNVTQVCMGDYVLCGGDIPAMAFIEGCVRLLPGVVGNPASLKNESFEQSLLEHPLYTTPRVWKNYTVPEVLLSGNHRRIADWHYTQSCNITRELRPDIWHTHIKNAVINSDEEK